MPRPTDRRTILVVGVGTDVAVVRELLIRVGCDVVTRTAEQSLAHPASFSPDIACIVLMPDAIALSDALALMEALRLQHIHAPTLAVLPSPVPPRPQLAALVRAGLDELCLAPRDRAPQLIAEAVLRLSRSVLPGELVRNLLNCTASQIHFSVSHVLRRASRPVTVGNLAAFFDVAASTLDRQLARARAPKAKHVIGLCRMAHVCMWLDQRPITEARLASILRFPDDGALRMQIKRTLGSNATSLRGRAITTLEHVWRQSFPKVLG